MISFAVQADGEHPVREFGWPW